jgi:hypothetical protein
MNGSGAEETRRFRIHELVDLFRQAICCVGPLAEKAGVDWLQEPPYDDWDAAAEGLFQSFVVNALENSGEADQVRGLPRYGFEPTPTKAFLAVENEGQEFGFVRFAGEDRSVSTAILLDLRTQATTLRNWNDCTAYLRLPDGRDVRQIEVTS